MSENPLGPLYVKLIVDYRSMLAICKHLPGAKVILIPEAIYQSIRRECNETAQPVSDYLWREYEYSGWHPLKAGAHQLHYGTPRKIPERYLNGGSKKVSNLNSLP